MCFRTYALRRVRDAFRENQKVEDPRAVDELLHNAQNTLAVIQRQVRSHTHTCTWIYTWTLTHTLQGVTCR